MSSICTRASTRSSCCWMCGIILQKEVVGWQSIFGGAQNKFGDVVGARRQQKNGA